MRCPGWEPSDGVIMALPPSSSIEKACAHRDSVHPTASCLREDTGAVRKQSLDDGVRERTSVRSTSQALPSVMLENPAETSAVPLNVAGWVATVLAASLRLTRMGIGRYGKPRRRYR